MEMVAAPDLIHDKLRARYEVRRIGACGRVKEHLFANGAERGIRHPLGQRLPPHAWQSLSTAGHPAALKKQEPVPG